MDSRNLDASVPMRRAKRAEPPGFDHDAEDDSSQKRSRGSSARQVPEPGGLLESQHTEAQSSNRDHAAAAITPRRLDYENGIIKSLRLENFKNHGNFELALGPHGTLLLPAL